MIKSYRNPMAIEPGGNRMIEQRSHPSMEQNSGSRNCPGMSSLEMASMLDGMDAQLQSSQVKLVWLLLFLILKVIY